MKKKNYSIRSLFSSIVFLSQFLKRTMNREIINCMFFLFCLASLSLSWNWHAGGIIVSCWHLQNVLIGICSDFCFT